MIGGESKRHYVLIKYFHAFMGDHTLHPGRKFFWCQAFSSEEILKWHIKDCFKISCKQKIKMHKKGEYVRFKNVKRKIYDYSPFMIYANFESILVPEDDGKQNPDECYTNKYQKHVACSYGYKLVCVDDKFSKPFRSYLGEDAVYKFINNLIKKVNNVVIWWKKIITRNLWWLKKMIKILKTLLNVGSLIILMLMMMLM